jgi:hypothetical protein
MIDPETETTAETVERVNDLFESLTQAIDAEEFKIFLDHIPIGLLSPSLCGATSASCMLISHTKP